MKIFYDGPTSNVGLSLLRLYRQLCGPSGWSRLKERLDPKMSRTLHYAQYISTNINRIFIKCDISPFIHAMRNTCAYYRGGSDDAPMRVTHVCKHLKAK